MARISSYNKDNGLTGNDLLLGSSFEGNINGVQKYATRTYRLSDLATYFGGFVNGIDLNDLLGRIGDLESSISIISTTITNNTTAISIANQSITTITNELLSQSTFQTNLSSTFGTFDENGNLTSLSQAFADQVLQTTASDRYANAQFVTNLAASVGTYDENGNLITLAEAFANQVLQVTTTDKFATSEFATNLAASFGTYNPDGTLATISESFANQLLQASTASDFADAQFVTTLVSNFGTFDENGNLLTVSDSYANQILSTANTSEFAQAEFVTNLASSFGTYDANGNLTAISSSFADDVLSTANTSEFAEASKLTNLGASFGTVNPDGSVSFSNTSTYSNQILNYVDSSSALATQLSNLQSQVTNIPVTLRQDDEPGILDGNNDLIYPLGSIWIDTNDSNAIYILIEDAGAPSGYSWSPTTSEALGDLILSNAQLQDDVSLLADDLSAEGTKLTTLTAQFGVYDPVTDTFTINNNSNVIASLRTYADADSTSAKKIDGINSVFNMVDANGNVIKNLATFNQEITTYVDANSAVAGRVDTLEAEVGDNAAAITAEQTARATEDAAIASSVSNLTATIGDENSGLVASVQQASEAVASLEEGLKASYALTVGAGNAISSMKLLAEDPNQPGLPPTSSIIFNTNNFKIQNGSGVDQFTINTTTGKAVFAGSLQGVDGTFTGRLTAGAVDIYSDNIAINIDSLGGQIKFVDDAGNDHTTMTASGATGNFNLICQENVSLLAKDGSGNTVSTLLLTTPSAWLTGDNVRLVADNSVYLSGTGQLYSSGFDSFLFYAGAHRLQGSSSSGITIASGITTLTVNETGVFVNGQQITTGGPTTDTNYYLNGITRSGDTLTFSVAGTASQSYTFGANAFNSTTIPTNNNQLTNGAGYITTTGSYTFTGSLTAQDFILGSDRILKENIKEYKPKPINIQYKTYNLIGDENKRVGVIAQELEIEHPEFIRENENGIKSVSYIDMLVAKVAELEARIKELEHGGTK